MRLLVSLKAISPFRSTFLVFRIVYAKVPAASIPAVQGVHEQRKRDQILMKLRPELRLLGQV